MPGQHTGPLQGFTFDFDPKSNDWGPFYNADLRQLEGIMMLSVITIGDNAPPGSPADGDRYVVGAAPTGAWSGEAGQVAFFENAAWVFFTPREGWLAWESTSDVLQVYDGATWGAPPPDLSGADTGDLPEGSNLYYTEVRVTANTDVAANTSARHSHGNKAQLDLVTDGDHDVRTDNPHSTTMQKAAVAGGLTTESLSGAGPHNPAASTDVMFVAGGSGAVVLNLPNANTREGRPVYVKKTSADSDVITLTPAGGNIDGSATLAIGGGGRDQVILMSDGTDYWTLGKEQ